MRSKVLHWFAAAFVAVALLAGTDRASAQDATSKGDDLKGNIAGAVGLGLLGAEVGLLMPPMFKLQDKWWAWAVFPTVFAAGGAVAGAVAFDAGSPSPAVTVSILGAGLALAIPAVVGTVAWSAKRENSELVASTGGLIRVGRTERGVGVPVLAVRPVYSQAEQLRHGVNQRRAFEIPLVSGRF